MVAWRAMGEGERRQAILDGAARLLAQYGHAKTTMADIAREAGIGVGSLYLEFASKDEIVAALSSTIHERVLFAMRRALRERAGASLHEQLHAVLEVRTATFLALAQEGSHACELVHCSSHPVRSAHARFKEEEQRLLGELLAASRERGELDRALDPERTARHVQRAFVLLSPPFLYEQPADELRRIAQEMCALLLYGLLARAEAAAPLRSRPRRAR
jgi:AcrR family transcriptional regulator